VLKRPSSRVAAPPGGHSTFSFSGMDVSKTPAAATVVAEPEATPAAALPPAPPSPNTRRYMSRPGDSYSVGHGYGKDNDDPLQKIGEVVRFRPTTPTNEEEEPVIAAAETTTTTISSSSGTGASKPASLGETITAMNEVSLAVRTSSVKGGSGGLGVLILANDHGHAVRSVVLSALKSRNTPKITVYQVPDPMVIPFMVQQLLLSLDSLLVVGVVSGDGVGSAPMLQTVCQSVLQAGLLAGKPVYPGLMTVKDALEVRACVPAAVNVWVDSMMVLVDAQSAPLQPIAAEEFQSRPAEMEMIAATEKSRNTHVNDDVVDTGELMAAFRKSLVMHGAYGIFGIQRKFRIVDDDGDKRLSIDEFRKMVAEHQLGWTAAQTQLVYNIFDKDGSGGIEFDEFLEGLRGPLSPRREQLVLKAFKLLDADGNGILELCDVQGKYNASRHPDVISGKCTETEILEAFLDTFNGPRDDGKVTPKDFCQYYCGVSASIDNDDYFELMIRNAWHMSGGTGWAANTSCRRVLVTHTDGRQTVEEIKDDLGIGDEDVEKMTENLKAQGINDISSITVKGNMMEVNGCKAVADVESVRENASKASAVDSALKQSTRVHGSGDAANTTPGGKLDVAALPVAGGPSPQRRSRTARVNPQTVSSITF